jgi:hypothetical protein
MVVPTGGANRNQESERLNLVHDAIVVAGAIGTAAKTSTSPEPTTGSMVLLKFTSGNSAASPTVAFNGGTARAIQLGGSASAAIEITLAANGVALFWFDGTVLHQIGVYS